MSAHSMLPPIEGDVLTGLVAAREWQAMQARPPLKLQKWKRLKGGALRADLIRAIAIEHGLGRIWPMTRYFSPYAHVGGPAVVRAELYRLADLGLVIIKLNGDDRRGKLVWPTPRLIEFFNSMPPLQDQIESAMEAARKPGERCLQ